MACAGKQDHLIPPPALAGTLSTSSGYPIQPVLEHFRNGTSSICLGNQGFTKSLSKEFFCKYIHAIGVVSFGKGISQIKYN